MARVLALGALLVGTTLAVSPAFAQGNFCGGFGGSGHPDIAPVIYPQLHFDRSNPGFDCQAWQAFIYLNWPALSLVGTPRGTPNPKARFGAPGATVWETYKTTDQTFLPGGADPGKWDPALPPLTAALPSAMTARIASGQLRVLSRVSKVSRAIIANATRAGIAPSVLNSITQAGGGTLYDQQSVPVYYEISLNKDQYQFIQQNALYNADTQLAFAQKANIVLPGGATTYGSVGALELKAAWKVLTPAEAKSGRFHTAQAILVGSPPPRPTVTVGLIGLHFFQMLGASNQGIWATFAQEDNAPVQPPSGKPFTFYNPNCKPAPCPINQESATPVPTQVVQIFPDDSAAANVNKNMKSMLQQYNAGPWQYYKLVDVQWTQSPIALGTAAQNAPLPYVTPPNNTDPNTTTLMNAVLETFQQASGTSCLACHQYASVSTSQSKPVTPPPQNASSYSFMFGYAQAK